MNNTPPEGLNGHQLSLLMNSHRTTMQQETASIGEAITVCAFLLYSFLLDQEHAGYGSAECSLLNLATSMPEEAKRMGLVYYPVPTVKQ